MTTSIRRTPLKWVGVTAAILATLVMLTVAQAAMAAKFEGPVLSKNKQERTFRMNPENHSNVTIKVKGGTEFERIDGYAGLHKGLKVDVIAHRSDGRWVASKIEKH